MKIICSKDYIDMSKKAAAVIAAEVIQKPDLALGLATGSTPEGIYANLIKWNKEGILDFSQIKTWNLDEYCGLGKTNPQSYWHFMQEKLFKHINIKQRNVHMLNGVNPNAEQECSNYEKSISKNGGIDLQLLGLGHDGHIGFNEPTNDFPSVTHQARLEESTIIANSRFFGSKESVPKYAYTMGIGTIMMARKILLVVSGTDKAETLKNVLEGPVCPEVPGSILQFHSNVVVVADCDALNKISFESK